MCMDSVTGILEQESLPEHGVCWQSSLTPSAYLSSSKRNLRPNRKRHSFPPSDIYRVTSGYKSTVEYCSCRTDHTLKDSAAPLSALRSMCSIVQIFHVIERNEGCLKEYIGLLLSSPRRYIRRFISLINPGTAQYRALKSPNLTLS